MKIQILKEESYRVEIYDWFFCNNKKQPVYFDSILESLHISGYTNNGKIFTNPIEKYKMINPETFVVECKNYSDSFLLKVENVNKVYKDKLNKQTFVAILNKFKS